MVNLEVLGPDLGAQIEGTGMVLEGLADEVKGNTIMIMARNNPFDHLTRLIRRPAEVSLEKSDTGEDVALSIKGDDGTTTLLIFPAAG